jgi:L-amino acid N-acyltransferase YncA
VTARYLEADISVKAYLNIFMVAENLKIRPMESTDWNQVADIYFQGLATGQATFETSVPSWDVWDAGHLQIGRFVAAADQILGGWCALSPVSKRMAYSGVAEISVYVGADFRGVGIGKRLLARLVEESEANGIWTLQASVFPENLASIAIHELCGFRKIGFRERIAKLNGKWRNTVLLERRSQLVGLD